MDNSAKFLLPPPNFGQKPNEAMQLVKPHYLTPSGMTLLPRERQPPPMYGPRGATVPAKYLAQRNRKQQQQYKQGNNLNNSTQHQRQQKTFNKPANFVQIEERPFCSACEVECASIDDLKRHRVEHEACPVDGCKFRGHPTVMDKHVTVLHMSGLFEKFKKLSTPEEIASWREERRKKYPTVANAQKRQEAREQRQKRGERLEESRSRFGKRTERWQPKTNDAGQNINDKVPGIEPNQTQQRKRSRNKNKNWQQNKNKLQQQQQKPVENVLDVKMETNELATCCNVKMFQGTSKLRNYQNAKAKKHKTTNALTSLIGFYGSDGDSENENDEPRSDKGDISDESTTLPVQLDASECCVAETPMDLDIPSEICHSVQAENHKEAVNESITNRTEELHLINESTAQDNSDDAPEEVPIAHSSVIPEPELNNVAMLGSASSEATIRKVQKPEICRKKKFIRKSGLDYRKAFVRKQNTMLEKLLERDIRHERNVLLQCVRFVCENKFFGVGSENKVQSECETEVTSNR